MKGGLDVFSDILQRLADLERRSNNFMRPATVKTVHPERGTVTLQYGVDDEGEPVLTPEIPWTEQAGALKTWNPPTVGQQMLMFSPSGELGAHSWAAPAGFSDDNPAPHNKGGEYVLDINNGAYRVHIDSAGNRTVTGKGKDKTEFPSIETKAGRIDFNQSGGSAGGVQMS